MQGDERARVVLTPIASPLPLTFVGLLLGSTILATHDLGWIPRTSLHETGWVLIAVPIPLQLMAAYFGFQARSATAATGSSALAAAWLGIALALIAAPPDTSHLSRATAMLVFAVALALVIPAAADVRGGSYLPATTLLAAAVRFLLTGLAALTGSAGLRDTTGVVGLVVCGIAFYAALALELEGATQTAVIPTLRTTQSRMALEATLDDQVTGLENEAGVRKNL